MSVLSKIKDWFSSDIQHQETIVWQAHWSSLLADHVNFYTHLSEDDKNFFEQRCLQFLTSTKIEGGVEVEVEDLDRLLVAASAVIPVWHFEGWYYFNLQAVYLLPAAFNENFECKKPDSFCTGMVGGGPMAGKMALSKPALHQGFDIAHDKQNVGIHEFVHLIDMADGTCDGYPERLLAYQHSIPWFELVRKKMDDIYAKKSNIRDYGATNEAEFLAVSSEYFFERPEMLKRRHPKLYEALEAIYKMDVEDINGEV